MTTTRQTNIFEALRKDHDRQRELIEELKQTQGESETRTRLHEELVRELEAHAAAEERSLYAELLAFDLTRGTSAHSIEEHQAQRDAVSELSEIDPSSPAWLRKFGELAHKALHHIEEEEHGVFQMAGKVLDDDRKLTMSDEFRRLKQLELEKLS